MEQQKKVTIRLELLEREAWALEEWCRRACCDDFRSRGYSETEASDMYDATLSLRDALRDACFEPR